MRISDWSSDVCSSDLAHGRCAPQAPPRRGHRFPPDARVPHRRQPAPDRLEGDRACAQADLARVPGREEPAADRGARHRAADDGARARHRSEEHTSELQSLMRISYAVFCLKKKTKKKYEQLQSPLTRDT